MKRLDIIIIISVLVISAGSLGVLKIFLDKDYEGEYVEVYLEGELLKRLPLDSSSDPQTFTVKSKLGINVIKIENGMVQIIESDCPHKTCIKEGAISEPGEMLVCLPHRVVVEIKGSKEEETDELSY